MVYKKYLKYYAAINYDNKVLVWVDKEWSKTAQWFAKEVLLNGEVVSEKYLLLRGIEKAPLMVGL